MSEADGRRSTFEDAQRQGNRGPMSEELEPTTPAEAVEWYLEERKSDLSEKSKENHRYRLEQFIKFCDENGIENMNEITGRSLHRFRTWRGKDIKPVTLHGQLQTLRVFLEFCASIEAVEPGMRERVALPNIDPSDEAREELLEEDRAEEILDHLERFAYASRDHVTLAILWHTGIRLGSLRALDVRDFDPDERCLDLRHRPESGTPLKNKAAAERSIAVSSHYCDVIQDYIDHNRDDVTDDNGRRPLFTSSRGRLSDGSVRESVYHLTQPCEIGECPHDKNPKTCEYNRHSQRAGCPSTRSPHAVRRGAITKRLRDGTPQEIVSDRCDASNDVLDQHYDERSDREKMHVRRDLIEGI